MNLQALPDVVHPAVGPAVGSKHMHTIKHPPAFVHAYIARHVLTETLSSTPRPSHAQVSGCRGARFWQYFSVRTGAHWRRPMETFYALEAPRPAGCCKYWRARRERGREVGGIREHLPQRGVHIAEARAHDVQEGLLRRLVHVRAHEPSVRRREQSPGRGRERGRESAWSRRRSSAQANTCARTQQTCLCSAESASEHSPVLHPYFRVTTFFFRSAHVHTLGVLPCRSTALRVPRPTSCICFPPEGGRKGVFERESVCQVVF